MAWFRSMVARLFWRVCPACYGIGWRTKRGRYAQVLWMPPASVVADDALPTLDGAGCIIECNGRYQHTCQVCSGRGWVRRVRALAIDLTGGE
jgi:DnaJ-class molecular chaperone